MPRKPTDKVIEHRISLSDFERDQIRTAIATQQANVAVDGITAFAQAAGTAMAGAGGLLAALVLMKWKAPDIIADVKNTAVGAIDTLVDNIVPGTPVEYRRQAQELAKRRAQLNRDQAAYCTLSADTADAAKCSTTLEGIDQYFRDRDTLYRLLRTEGYTAGQRGAVYYGLGDVNPEFVE